MAIMCPLVVCVRTQRNCVVELRCVATKVSIDRYRKVPNSNNLEVVGSNPMVTGPVLKQGYTRICEGLVNKNIFLPCTFQMALEMNKNY